MRSKRWLPLLCLIPIYGISLSKVQAVPLESADSNFYGVDSLTRDFNTGFDWIDVTLSTGFSYDAAAAQTASGGLFSGFRHANFEEFRTLEFNAGITLSTFGTITTPSQLQAVQNFQSFVGITSPSSTVNRTEGLLGVPDVLNRVRQRGWVFRDFVPSASRISAPTGAGGSGSDRIGNWLLAEIGATPRNPAQPFPGAGIPEDIFFFECPRVLGRPCPGVITFYDPVVAIGYDYIVDSGTENFASVLLPVGFTDSIYDLFLFNGMDFVDSGIDLMGGVEYNFINDLGEAGGLDRFGIRGIEAAAGIDPNDPLGFVTGLSFVAPTNGAFTMSAISFDTDQPPPTVPEPTTLLLLGLGLTGLGFARRRLH